MDNLTFTANIINSLAWPLTSVVIIILLKTPIVNLLKNIKKLKYKDAEFNFEKAISEVPVDTNVTPLISSNQLKLAELSPRGAVLEAWLELEDVIDDVMSKSNTTLTNAEAIKEKRVQLNHQATAQLLLMTGKLTTTSYEKLQKLRKIRNKAVHLTDEVIESNEAETFIRLIEEIKLELKNA